MDNSTNEAASNRVKVPLAFKVMKEMLRYIFLVFIGLPVSFSVCLFISPILGWVEKTFAFELVGHSGPHMEVYVFVYMAYLFIGSIVVIAKLAKRPN